MSKAGVVLVHAHPLFRQGLRYHLSGHPDFRITGEAGNGQQAIQLVDYTDPDIVVIELDLPGVNGLEVARAIKRSHPNIGIILLSADQDEKLMIKALRAGVSAFVPRNVPWEELLKVLQQVRRGDYPINELVLSMPQIAASVLEEFRMLSAEEQGDNIYSPLSPREIEVLELVAAGRTNKEIAVKLNISNQTVKNHISSILRKLAVNDRTQAVVYAMRRGWIKVAQPSERA
ncbi:LuxR C-terminal-related transcriptional regulator [Kallotenue papyrolyticum]|uniref:LuxR C-terminal-related transcriptional regulator n=1 Tax=Kallotenue papyrolyticum TaxID=1325125 RepID=UPI00047855AA|nr:response regulator transcription factor [Kallotenue papyrolyticum]